MHDIKFAEADRILRKNGYVQKSCTGSHFRYENDMGRAVFIPRKVNPCIWKRLCKENNLYTR